MEVNNRYDNNYYNVHFWLKAHFGRAKKCENISCKNKNPKRFEWALKKGKQYKKIRDNFFQLCPSCHRKYDMTDEIRKRISKAMKGKPAHNKTPVILNGKIKFDSITDASKKTGVGLTSISNNINGLSKTTSIGIWKVYQQKN